MTAQSQSQPQPQPATPTPPGPTVFGLSPTALHDRYWASRGVQVVRRAMPTPLVPHAHLFLLLQQRTLCYFELPTVVDRLVWDDADLVLLRLRDQIEHAYRERIVHEADGTFVRIERLYGSHDRRFARAALTNRPAAARVWQGAESPRDGWRKLRLAVPKKHRWPLAHEARVFDAADADEAARCARLLVECWTKPGSTVNRATPRDDGTWADPTAVIGPGAQCVGRLWIGAGRALEAGDLVVGPDVLWDDPAHTPDPGEVRWMDLEPTGRTEPLRPRSLPPVVRVVKRAFDVVFALVALALTLPIYPIVMLAIWLEDGRPFFFLHTRESCNGKTFPCIKFRSMEHDADRRKAEIEGLNQVDGPQFYIENDPRITRMGNFMRKTNIDEFPQFFNVLIGQMSIVGPRPSPYKENQYSPAWREARLSVRPGVTGLWQVKRSREPGMDFQEWIRYDIHYVESASWKMDLYILWATFKMMLGIKG